MFTALRTPVSHPIRASIRWIGCASLMCGTLVATAAAGETEKASVIERKVAALPKSAAIGGPLPRPVLMVMLQERGERVGSRTISSFWVFDPAEPEKGLRRIFSGPGDDQYLRFMTPLFDGWGVASGQLNPAKEPDDEGPWFWFNLLSGETGPPLDVDVWHRSMDKGWLVGGQTVDEENGQSFDRIVRYHPLEGVVKTTELNFDYLNWLGRSEVLGVARLDVGERVVRLDVETSQYEVISEPPPKRDGIPHRSFDYSISPAGKDGRDGIFSIDGFSLWFRPDGGDWHSVIRNVHIVKTFGGSPPSLPVRYVGDGRFAVAKTVRDEVELPETTPRDGPDLGAAEAVTMLIDGVTGQVLKETATYIYSENPRPSIPDDWWAADLKPKTPEPESKRRSHFHWDEESRQLRFADDKLLKLGKDDESLESDDGTSVVIYQQCPRGGGKEPTKVPFRIIDGKTGQIHTAEVRSDFFEAWVDVSWQLLCNRSPDAQTLKDFEDAGPGPLDLGY
jgi:hypothetical protein